MRSPIKSISVCLNVINILEMIFCTICYRGNSQRTWAAFLRKQHFPQKCDPLAHNVKMQCRGQKRAANALSLFTVIILKLTVLNAHEALVLKPHVPPSRQPNIPDIKSHFHSSLNISICSQDWAELPGRGAGPQIHHLDSSTSSAFSRANLKENVRINQVLKGFIQRFKTILVTSASTR